jgi:hypothetical protein
MLACAAQIVEGGPLACLRAIAEAQGRGCPHLPIDGWRIADSRGLAVTPIQYIRYCT